MLRVRNHHEQIQSECFITKLNEVKYEVNKIGSGLLSSVGDKR